MAVIETGPEMLKHSKGLRAGTVRVSHLTPMSGVSGFTRLFTARVGFLVLAVAVVLAGGAGVASPAQARILVNGAGAFRLTTTTTTTTPAVVEFTGGEANVPFVVQWDVATNADPELMVGNRAKHRYSKPGTYGVRVTLDGGVVADTTVTVLRPAPAALKVSQKSVKGGRVRVTQGGKVVTYATRGFTPSWLEFDITMMPRVASPNRTPVTGLTAPQVSGVEWAWKSTFDTASFAPCQQVTWSWDRAGEPAGRDGLYGLTQRAFDILSERTGLVFTETVDPDGADITLRWGDADFHTRYGEGAIAITALFFDDRHSVIEFSPTMDGNRNEYNGFHSLYNVPGFSVLGNGIVIIHEVMHALGFRHVYNPTSIMHPNTPAATFGDGDLAGFAALYPRDYCPA